jgi:hypothetical protein
MTTDVRRPFMAMRDRAVETGTWHGAVGSLSEAILGLDDAETIITEMQKALRYLLLAVERREAFGGSIMRQAVEAAKAVLAELDAEKQA